MIALIVSDRPETASIDSDLQGTASIDSDLQGTASIDSDLQENSSIDSDQRGTASNALARVNQIAPELGVLFACPTRLHRSQFTAWLLCGFWIRWSDILHRLAIIRDFRRGGRSGSVVHIHTIRFRQLRSRVSQRQNLAIQLLQLLSQVPQQRLHA